ncbi:MAG: cyclic lactone autoinducer peptide [Lachnospiraceae bacterium]|nr:cyclic lactone autoinducer peptide [Lachnospiraceae bacterium]
MAEKKERKNKVAEKLAALFTRELKFSANSAGSMYSYQPKTPAGLERFRK